MSQPLRVLFIGASGVEAVLSELKRGGYEPGFEQIVTESELRERCLAIGISLFPISQWAA